MRLLAVPGRAEDVPEIPAHHSALTPDYGSDGNQLQLRLATHGGTFDCDFGAPRVGHGSFGSVYMGLFNRKPVAVKISTRNPNMILDEARAFNVLGSSHPNIVDYLFILNISFGGHVHPIIVMEFMNGQPLSQWLEDHADFRTRTQSYLNGATQFPQQLDSALTFMHSRFVTHRDISTNNAFILSNRNSYRLKLFDLGLAIPLDRILDKYEICGTPYYYSPEVMCGQAPNPAHDRFAFARVLQSVLEIAPHPFSRQENLDSVMISVRELCGPMPDHVLQLIQSHPHYSTTAQKSAADIADAEAVFRTTDDEATSDIQAQYAPYHRLFTQLYRESPRFREIQSFFSDQRHHERAYQYMQFLTQVIPYFNTYLRYAPTPVLLVAPNLGLHESPKDSTTETPENAMNDDQSPR